MKDKYWTNTGTHNFFAAHIQSYFQIHIHDTLKKNQNAFSLLPHKRGHCTLNMKILQMRIFLLGSYFQGNGACTKVYSSNLGGNTGKGGQRTKLLVCWTIPAFFLVFTTHKSHHNILTKSFSTNRFEKKWFFFKENVFRCCVLLAF